VQESRSEEEQNGSERHDEMKRIIQARTPDPFVALWTFSRQVLKNPICWGNAS
jgi:hypothetical protein